MPFYHGFRKKSRKDRDHANAGAVRILVENTQIAEKAVGTPAGSFRCSERDTSGDGIYVR
jgi:hypothetical protein